MKVRNPKTGEVFESITRAWMAWSCPEPGCGGEDKSDCEFSKTVCRASWCHDHSAEAVDLMGFEVIDDSKVVEIDHFEEEAKMEENKKPLAEWTLGEVKAECEMHELCDDCPMVKNHGGACMINKDAPADWDLTEKPRWTAEEIERAKAIMLLWPKADSIVLREEVSVENDKCVYIHFARSTFPSLPFAPLRRALLSDIVEGGQC